MAKKVDVNRITRNRIGDWIANSGLAELERTEERLLHEKNLNVDQIRENRQRMQEIYEEGLLAFATELETLKKEFNDRLEAERELLEKQVISEVEELVRKNGELSDRVKELIEQLNLINKERNDNVKIAEKYCGEAISLYNVVSKEKKYIKFSNKELIAVGDLLGRLDTDGLSPEAQQAIAIKALCDIDVLKRNAELDNNAFLIEYQSLKCKVDSFVDGFNQIVWLDEVNNVALDVDHWTNSRYGTLQNLAVQLSIRVDGGLENNSYLLSQISEDVQRLKHLEVQRDMLVNEAKERANASRHIVEIGNRISNCLINEEKITSCTGKFEDGDDRKAYVVDLFREADAIKIAFVFFPNSDKEIVPLCIVRQGQYMSESRYSELCSAIAKVMEKAKIRIAFNKALSDSIGFEEEVLINESNRLNNKIHKALKI